MAGKRAHPMRDTLESHIRPTRNHTHNTARAPHRTLTLHIRFADPAPVLACASRGLCALGARRRLQARRALDPRGRRCDGEGGALGEAEGAYALHTHTKEAGVGKGKQDNAVDSGRHTSTGVRKAPGRGGGCRAARDRMAWVGATHKQNQEGRRMCWAGLDFAEGSQRVTYLYPGRHCD